MRPLNCSLVLGLAGLLMLAGCRKRADRTSAIGGAEPVAAAPDGSAEAAAGGKAYAAPPPLPANASPPALEPARFNAPQPMNMYAPRYAGDYQTQLDAYNRVLRRWIVDSSNAPRNLQEIMGTFNSPKPPQPPAGRRLVYDPKTMTVSLQ